MRITATLIILLLAPSLFAQKVQFFKQRDMKKWGIPAGNYSGITHIENDRYALVSDKQEADGWTEVSIRFLPSGNIGEMHFIAHHYDSQTQGKARDSEGIAYVPRQGFFIAAENDQQITEVTHEGIPTGRHLAVPPCFRTANTFNNYGFESLTYDTAKGIFWTTTEQGLKTDVGTPATFEHRTPTLLRIQSFGPNLQPRHQYAYKTEAPVTARKPRKYAFGVPELLALDDTTLLVMEREINIPKHYNRARCSIRLFSVNPVRHQPITDTTQPLSETDSAQFLQKKEVAAFHTGMRLFGRKNFANYEGMCLGPKLSGGRQTVLLIADSQGRAGKGPFHLIDYIRVMIIPPAQ